VQKRGKERGRSWLTNGPWFLLVVVAGCGIYWLINREPSYIALQYGELIQVLNSAKQNPAVTVQKVRVGRAGIRGEIITSDTVSRPDEGKNEPITFRTLRWDWKMTKNCTPC